MTDLDPPPPPEVSAVPSKRHWSGVNRATSRRTARVAQSVFPQHHALLTMTTACTSLAALPCCHRSEPCSMTHLATRRTEVSCSNVVKHIRSTSWASASQWRSHTTTN